MHKAMDVHATATFDAPVGYHIRVRGLVQGVGFRPFVYRLAKELKLAGWVRNDGEGVEIVAQGDAAALAAFRGRLRCEAPAAACIESVCEKACTPLPEARDFVIASSGRGPALTMIGNDRAVCVDCLAELFDPHDHRYRYPFINCTQCGPRYTITRALPYDRAMTSMELFVQCPSCLAEYSSPAHRRFHAEPNACPECGPHLSLHAADGSALRSEDAISATLTRLASGEIVAIKGLGGFHLVCDARNPHAVERLRVRKSREEKPFAIMVANAASAALWTVPSAAERVLLESAERPIVLLKKHATFDSELQGVAPGLAWLGVMLPYTPLHYLLFHEAAGRPDGTEWLAHPQSLTLVMTSANPGGEPLVTDNCEALRRLYGLADAYLMHDRPILVRCDDSLVRCESVTSAPRFVRRARGYTPRAIRLASGGPSVLALGGDLKNTVVLTRGNEAFVSQHVGNLDNAATREALLESAVHLQRLLEVEPQIVAHDLHPDFFSTQAAADLACVGQLRTVAVQHHHAHIAAVLAEHRVTEPALGLALDGVGFGTDGGAWGGELLLVEGARCERLGHIRELSLPGGDRAAREPWRMAAAVLHALGEANAIATRFAHQPAASMVVNMLNRRLNCPPTSSMGRWFDAAAGLLGICETMAFEGQAAMLLEGLAEQYGEQLPHHRSYVVGEDNVLDLLPLAARLAVETSAERGAALFHATVIAALDEWVGRAASQTGLRRIVLGGGCFLNRILSDGLFRRLAARGLSVLEAREVPPNDGGLALGQAWVALQSEN